MSRSRCGYYGSNRVMRSDKHRWKASTERRWFKRQYQALAMQEHHGAYTNVAILAHRGLIVRRPRAYMKGGTKP